MEFLKMETLVCLTSGSKVHTIDYLTTQTFCFSQTACTFLSLVHLFHQSYDIMSTVLFKNPVTELWQENIFMSSESALSLYTCQFHHHLCVPFVLLRRSQVVNNLLEGVSVVYSLQIQGQTKELSLKPATIYRVLLYSSCLNTCKSVSSPLHHYMNNTLRYMQNIVIPWNLTIKWQRNWF